MFEVKVGSDTYIKVSAEATDIMEILRLERTKELLRTVAEVLAERWKSPFHIPLPVGQIPEVPAEKEKATDK